ncbi:hypothetical protein D8674_007655 [Pyrus ussuriensis x Pyrus communis]|uniref:Uncharacterized protein n=1 Tax=Pyrus ussuriensis x Pyrus communis TaxID=2448454 RepID=A0A5N5HQK6_9ROSA|nr:hypothetical protein D8674_007655 [Pyrus ussuriensis x Pyrus communis]
MGVRRARHIQNETNSAHEERDEPWPLNHALTTVLHVNKTDVVTRGTTFGMEDQARCPGIGERKVKRLYDTFHEPFKRVVASHPAWMKMKQQWKHKMRANMGRTNQN